MWNEYDILSKHEILKMPDKLNEVPKVQSQIIDNIKAHLRRIFLSRKTLMFYVFLLYYKFCDCFAYERYLYALYMLAECFANHNLFSSYRNSLTTNIMSNWTTHFDDTKLSVTINLFCYKTWRLIENAANSSKNNEYHFHWEQTLSCD